MSKVMIGCRKEKFKPRLNHVHLNEVDGIVIVISVKRKGESLGMAEDRISSLSLYIYILIILLFYTFVVEGFGFFPFCTSTYLSLYISNVLLSPPSSNCNLWLSINHFFSFCFTLPFLPFLLFSQRYLFH